MFNGWLEMFEKRGLDKKGEGRKDRRRVVTLKQGINQKITIGAIRLQLGKHA